MAEPESWMWAGQRAFRHLAHADARELFGSLDASLEPRVGLVGVRWADADGRGPEVVVEPPAYAPAASSLAGIRGRVEAAEPAGMPAALATDPRLALHHLRQAGPALLQRLLAGGVSAFEGDADTVSFCSFPQRVGAYLVSVVVQLERRAHAALQPPLGERTGAGPFASLLDATIDEFLGECALALTQPELGRYGVLSHEIPDVLRAAGKKLMLSPGQPMQGMRDLFDICNVVASMPFEGREAQGGLLVAPRDQPEVRAALTLGESVSLRDYRAIRKLLEISGDGLDLLCADGAVFGLGAARPPAGPYRVAFSGRHRWSLAVGDCALMEVIDGQPRLPRASLEPDEVRRALRLAFPDAGVADVEALGALVAAAAAQRHGTLVVVSAGAAAEAVRLRRQGVAVVPEPMTPRLMRLVTAIDGAVLLDPQARCHAIGTILDGSATDAGRPSRGARYNSAVRYVGSSAHPCVAVVVSEDGVVDVVTA